MRHRTLLSLTIAAALLTACQRSEVPAKPNAEPSPVAAEGSADQYTQAATAEEKALVLTTQASQMVAAEPARRQERERLAELAVMDAAAPTTTAPAPPAPPSPSVMGLIMPMAPPPAAGMPVQQANTETYADMMANPVHTVATDPVSTFSIDVDTGAYSNIRRMLRDGQRPPVEAVRTEELLNYFDYGYPQPTSPAQPFRVSTELAAAPWNNKRLLLQVGLQGYDVAREALPPANLVFLLDTSGSMAEPDKLPLVQASLRELARQMRPQDRVSIVVYAGSAGLVLPPTPGNDEDRIAAALDNLQAGGSTNGGEGIQLAYQVAREAFIPGGVNRVILATDGDFNVGIYDQKQLETLVADQRQHGIALSTLGFGRGNYNDAMAEQLADVGDGNHAYIDSLREAHKVLREELGATLLTIAKDVKIQLEFNPAVVSEYRLIGYENRALAREDFNNDRVDAGEIGAGHDVTALYEIALVGSGGEWNAPSRYPTTLIEPSSGGELGLLRLRYKRPGETQSQLMEQPLSSQPQPASDRLRWAAAVAAYGELLRGGEHAGSFDWNAVASLARSAIGTDSNGTRREFIELVERAARVTGSSADTDVAIAGD